MIYPGLYRDSVAEEAIALHNDGKTLRLRVRGIDFAGSDFDTLEPVRAPREATGAGFTLDPSGTLCAFELSFSMPMPLVTPPSWDIWALQVRFALGALLPNGRIASEVVELALEFQGQTFRSMGTSGWFEDELVDLQRRLPPGVYMLACINCAFSDYSPAGHGCFGGLACFRGAKEAYKKVNTKADLFQVWDRMTEFVQETYVCPEFERRRPGAGYRG
jgi:hypothetical protein